MSLPTLLDIAKLDAGIGYPIIEEAVKIAPELMVVPADTILGTTMELTVRNGLPAVAFRNANEGVPRSKSSYETRNFQTHILDHQIAVDEQIVNGDSPQATGPVPTPELYLVVADPGAVGFTGFVWTGWTGFWKDEQGLE